VETAVHQFGVRVEKALGVFLDIEEAFNVACYDTMCDALVRHGITPLYGGLGPPWRAMLL